MFLKINTLICEFSQASGLLGPNVGMLRSGDEFMLPEYVNAVGIVFSGMRVYLCNRYATMDAN